MTSAYVDTSALLPLLDRGDRDHAAVARAVEVLASEGAQLVAASYVLVEAGALVKARLGVAAFRRLGEVAAEALDVVWVDAELHGEAWKRAARESRGGASLVDWVSFLVMRRRKVERALALDKHFVRQGFHILP